MTFPPKTSSVDFVSFSRKSTCPSKSQFITDPSRPINLLLYTFGSPQNPTTTIHNSSFYDTKGPSLNSFRVSYEYRLFSFAVLKSAEQKSVGGHVLTPFRVSYDWRFLPECGHFIAQNCSQNPRVHQNLRSVMNGDCSVLWCSKVLCKKVWVVTS